MLRNVTRTHSLHPSFELLLHCLLRVHLMLLGCVLSHDLSPSKRHENYKSTRYDSNFPQRQILSSQPPHLDRGREFQLPITAIYCNSLASYSGNDNISLYPKPLLQWTTSNLQPAKKNCNKLLQQLCDFHQAVHCS